MRRADNRLVATAGGASAPKIDGVRCLLLEEEGPEEVEKRLNEILNAPVR
ncbi:MAG: hypothetical protein V8T10_01875 [Merdibacter sp.]